MVSDLASGIEALPRWTLSGHDRILAAPWASNAGGRRYAGDIINRGPAHDYEVAMSNVEDKLAELGLELPEYVPPSGSYLVGYRSGNLVFTSGVGPRTNESNVTGVMGADCTIEEGYAAARRTCLRMLSNVKGIVGDLD